ncbi:MAG TPA: hypothetical protein VN673_06050 [Clostridia bacterium]|nr:hypothetical protein [Clostridia bacterium]
MTTRPTILAFAGIFVFLLPGCGPQWRAGDVAPQKHSAAELDVRSLEPRTNSPVRDPDSAKVVEVGQKTNTPPAVTSSEASHIATAEARRRRGVEVDVRYSRFEEHRWVVFLVDRDSDEVGNHCWVEIGTNGLVLQYHGGR